MSCTKAYSRVVFFLGWMLLLLTLAACVQSEPKVTPDRAVAIQREVWDYVALGDSRTASADWPELFAAYVENDLKVRVRVHNWASVNQSSEALLTSLKENDSLRQVVEKAEIVTLWTGGYKIRDALTKEYVSCDPVVEAYGGDLEEIIAEVLALRGRQATIIRLLDSYQIRVSILEQLGLLADKKVCLDDFNRRTHQVAVMYMVPVAAVHKVFNGQHGDEDAGDKGYFRNDVRLSAAGDQVVATLLRELGYRVASPMVVASGSDF